ncbi:MBL fold metallo-hydrolase [Pseudooceanicola sediminis]|nr:MBL fold metallo-hydrolase [Pseudooceanicola sediminis]
MQPDDTLSARMGLGAAGEAVEVAPDVRRLLAPNPSAFTGPGTNTYLVGQRGLAVIDPGPNDEAHLDAILRSVLPGQSITHILVTHAHLDHAPLARTLAARTGASVLAYGDALAGRSSVMQHLAATSHLGGGEGTDHAFVPDISLPDGTRVTGDGWSLRALWTPGHFGNHLSFAMNDTIFTGDLVMGWATSLVSPPDGDLTDFMASCVRLQTLRAARFLPGHGPAVEDPAERLTWLIAHRKSREAALLDALTGKHATPSQLAAMVYQDTPPHLMPAATRNVLAHLIDLTGRNLARPVGDLHAEALFKRL